MPSLYDLLSKYDVPGPRYTSYPTVPAWTEAVGPRDYETHLAAIPRGEPLSLYFHLPFCESLCHFCGCMQVITRDHARSRPYVEALKREVERVSGLLPRDRGPAVQIHFGGGTPNFLAPEELSELVEVVRGHFDFAPKHELAIEMHPRTSTSLFCENLARLAFNRISIGVQDFDPHVQALINRHQTYEVTEQMVSALRALGFSSINMDLVYGLPGQTEETFSHTLDLVLGLKPSRLAVYSYAHVPWVRPVQRSFRDEDLPSPTLKLALFEAAYAAFTGGGYTPIGMDHFALADDELAIAARHGGVHRNFMGYSTYRDAHQIGFGMSAISYANGHYFQNAKKLNAYASALEREGLATFRGCLLNREDALRRDLITALMCEKGIDTAAFSKKWAIDFSAHFAAELSALAPFVSDGLLKISPDGLRVISPGHLFLRNMAMVFDAYLANVQAGASTPIFSRTV